MAADPEPAERHATGQRPLASGAIMATAPFDRRPVDDPAELGIDAGALDRRSSPGRSRDIDEGPIPVVPDRVGARRHGRGLAHARRRRARSRYVIFSATKPVVAGGMWILMGEGSLDVSRRGRRVHSRVRDERQGRDHRRAGDAAHVGLPGRAVRSRSNGTTATGGSRGSRAGAATGSRARGSSTTRHRRTGCSRSSSNACSGARLPRRSCASAFSIRSA